MDKQVFRGRRQWFGSGPFPHVHLLVLPEAECSLGNTPEPFVGLMHDPHASVICFKLELEEVWGDGGFHLVKCRAT